VRLRTVPAAGERLAHLDALRGLAIVLMVLDHARDFFGDLRLEPEHIASTTPLLFGTRWVTHLCAPTFVFLAGASAALSGRRQTRAQFARAQAARGAWLIVLEFTLVSLAWTLQPSLRLLILQVIAAIGAGLLALAALQYLGRPAVAGLALIVLFGHDGLAPIDAADLGAWGPAWTLAFERGWFSLGGDWGMQVIYPLVPWVALVALGWACGEALAVERALRRRRAWIAGAAALAFFALLRASNLWGDPAPWSAQASAWRSVASFLNVSKYPPSLAFLSLTLGAAALLCAALDRERPSAPVRALSTWGRAPLFAYLAHIYLLHAASAGLYALEIGRPLRLFEGFVSGFPPGYGHGLAAVYAAWLACLALLYVPVRRWGELKQAGRSRLWRYF
jgi:uncharacterized membrane protein